MVRQLAYYGSRRTYEQWGEFSNPLTDGLSCDRFPVVPQPNEQNHPSAAAAFTEDRSQLSRIPVLLTEQEIRVLVRAADFTEGVFEGALEEAGRAVKQSVLRTAHSVLLVALDRAAMRSELEGVLSSPTARPVRLPRAHRPGWGT